MTSPAPRDLAAGSTLAAAGSLNAQRAGRRWRLARTLCVALLLLSASSVQGASRDEYTVKAVMVLNIAKFTSWPEPAGNDGLQICVFGDDEVQRGFQQIAGQEAGAGREVHISKLNNPGETSACHIVFYGGKDRRDLSRVMTATVDEAILTIGEMKGFTRYGGIFNMVRKDSKVQLDLNVRNARRSGLTISSRLQKLCNIVGDRD
ncbi:YfiR family protein [Granulosicoccaceae sp. 1_MG-2023]|nr:YfiR family protein [Granulosicoccaceae sp. 1_MG-2023]